MARGAISMEKIFIASDHNGNAARAYIVKLLEYAPGYDVRDIGPAYDEKVDYPDVVQKLADCMRAEPGSTGILICGTGSGMCIAANRFIHIRAALVTDRATARLAREHNDANVMVLGQWRTPLDEMEDILVAWSNAEFAGGRHVARLQKLSALGGV